MAIDGSIRVPGAAAMLAALASPDPGLIQDRHFVTKKARLRLGKAQVSPLPVGYGE